MRHSRAPIFATCVFSVMLLASRSGATLELPVALSATSCPTLSLSEVRRILDIELRSIAAGRTGIARVPTRLSLTCKNNEMWLEALVQGRPVSRTQRFRPDTPTTEGRGRERLVAIAAAELVFSAWVAATPKDAPDAEPSPKTPSDATPKALPASVSRRTASSRVSVATSESGKAAHAKTDGLGAALSLGPLWQMFLSNRCHLFGGAAGVDLRFQKRFHVGAGAAVEAGRTARSIGDVRLFAASGHLAVGMRYANGGSVDVGGEIGARFGLGLLKGASSDAVAVAHKVSGGFGGPLLRLFVRTAGRTAAGLFLESGYAAYGNEGRVADGRTVYMKAFWISAQAAVVFELPR